jgi:glycosyltransferase involved in cell wall biosynthesis
MLASKPARLAMTSSSANALDDIEASSDYEMTGNDAVGFGMVTVRPGRVGGAESYAKELLSAYQTLAQGRIMLLANGELAQVYATLGVGKVSIHRLDGFRIYDGAIGRAGSLTRATLFPGRLRRASPSDLAAVHYPVVVPLPRLRVPSIVTLHDMQHHDMPQNFSRAMRAYRAIAYDAAARHADRVITVSDYSRRRLVEALGVSANRVHAIPHGIDHKRFTPQAQDTDLTALDRLHVPRRYIFYPANLWSHKNHKLLLAAFSRISDTSVHLVLTGQQYASGDEFDKEVRRHRFSDRVHHLGYVSSDILPALYRQAIGLVFPSLYEGFGAPPLEAMACGCPVAASGAGSLGEICCGAVLMFNPNDEASITSAIDELVEDQMLRTQLRQDGLAHATGFTWERSAREHLKIYGLAIHSNET